MEIILDRKYKKDTYTIGIFSIDGVRFSESIEDKDRGLDDSMSISEIKSKKIYGETAIPTGRYEIKFTKSTKFANRDWAKPYGGKVPSIQNVKGYSGIRIHPLNTAKDSLGCIGLGRNTKKGEVTRSTTYYLKFIKEYLIPALKRNEKVFITIK